MTSQFRCVAYHRFTAHAPLPPQTDAPRCLRADGAEPIRGTHALECLISEPECIIDLRRACAFRTFPGATSDDARLLSWNKKQERQYEHIKKQTKERGPSEDRAEEIAARTVNKDRAQQGQARQQSKTSTRDIPPPRRGGIRSGNRYGPGGRTKEQLYEDARRQNIKGRSKMTKKQLQQALSRS